MLLLLILITTEVLTPIVLRQQFFKSSKIIYFISILLHLTLSIWLWILYFQIISFNSFFDSPQNIWLKMNMNGMLAGVVFPRILLIIFHFSGKFVKRKSGGHMAGLTNAGLIVGTIIFIIIALSTFKGRFNFKTENITVHIRGLHKDLDGLRIVQISDLHMTGFYHHKYVLQDVIEMINTYKPDLILNTGDFISYGWREFGRNDTILAKSRSKFGNYAVMGNHDFGTYDPDYTEADRENNVLIMHKLIKASGYTLLNNEFTRINIGKARIGLIGVTTKGRHPHMIHGDVGKASMGLDSVDIKILMTHDPNDWELAVTGKTDIDLTLSGHTHGMQMGILTKKFKWSPAKYFYPHWNGLYTDGNQVQYVNRGLGVLAIPFRIWMPPEITIITLRPE